MAQYPTNVEVNEASLAQLQGMYKTAYKDVVNQIQHATVLGVANRKKILAQIDGILTNLGVDTNTFIAKELPQYYKTGADQAVEQLQDVGAKIAVKTGFNRIHQAQIKALVSDTATSFADSLQAVRRSATTLLGKQLKAEIRQAIGSNLAQGAAVEQATKNIKAILQSDGLSALRSVYKNSNGTTVVRNWQLNDYAEMLYRTKTVEARNIGLGNRMLENGYDLVQVSSHGSLHQACFVWEGRILSMTGNTPGYPTLDDAEAAGLFHPNCEHAINVVQPDLADELNIYNPDTGQYQKGLSKTRNELASKQAIIGK